MSKKQKIDEEKNGVIVRFAEIAEEKGGFSEVARVLGKHPTTFYNLVSRNAKPSVDTLAELASAYPDIDLNYIITGIRSVGVPSDRVNELESPKAREIIDHYGGIDNLPKMEYMTNMGYLFRVGKLMGIPFKLATGHARNTFAHLCLNHWGFDLESTAAMMGLLSTDTIRRYGKVRLERIDRKVHWPQ